MEGQCCIHFSELIHRFMLSVIPQVRGVVGLTWMNCGSNSSGQQACQNATFQ